MNSIDSQLLLVGEGFKSLDVAEKYMASALDWLRIWLTEETFAEYNDQIRYLIASRKWNVLLDSFYQVIPFGTGGRRGPVGIGPNRINPWTVQASAQGHSQYLIKRYGDEAGKKGVVLAYDVRKYLQKGIYDDNLPNPVRDLDCKQLALAAAEVYAANGIKVHIFKEVRSTPQLSFVIRNMGAVAGDMFSASHNPPSDNGKKVYDEFGGQLIPPDDQVLVDEVTKNVDDIKRTDIPSAMAKGLISYIGEEQDRAYHEAVSSVSLSDDRGIKILYSPLHGTGLTSIYPVLKQMGFDIRLDPKTSNLSGAFENVTFNIPNPEVVESFDASIPAADESDADIIISSDPDADRIGLMARHNDAWHFLTGQEIGVLLAEYGISRLKESAGLADDSVIIKTEVTTALIEKMARENGIRCMGDLLVGFKYIGHQMNLLEKKGKIKDFIMGAEESHGYVMGNYCREKDGAAAAVWMAEISSRLKTKNRTLLDRINRIYSRYGYCHNYLTEIRLLGAKGKDQISMIMEHLRNSRIDRFGDFHVRDKLDRWDGEPQPHLSLTDTWARNVLVFQFDNLPDTQSISVVTRPSGTEPKIKMYFEVFGKPVDDDGIAREKQEIVEIRERLEKDFMKYCYNLLGVDFPDRGFALFWQLPLEAKMKYFEIEKDIASLKEIRDKRDRRIELDKILEFLGSDPIQKIDKAFRQKHRAGVAEYLDI